MKKYTVKTSTTASKSMTANVQTYVSLKYGTKYYYQVWAKIDGSEKKGATKNFATRSDKPNTPTLKAYESKTDLGIQGSPTVTWSAVSNAKSYTLYLYDASNQLVQKTTNVTGTKFAFNALAEEGTYQAYIEAVNPVGTKGKSAAVTFTVHPDVTVTFVDAASFVDVGDDYVPATLGTETVHYGGSANPPATNPSHQGYTFKSWSGNYKSVTEDCTMTAVYAIDQYTVTYINSQTGDVLGTEKVDYYGAANPVSYDAPTGFVKTGYEGWDKDYTCITEDTTLTTCYGWYDEDLPVHATVLNAVREYDGEDAGDNGYTVTISLQNWPDSSTKGRAVVALKTMQGKLLTSTESAAFSIKKGTTKSIEVFVPYEDAATVAEAYVVGQYKDAVPISNNCTFEIDQSNTMTNWSTEDPGNGVNNKQERTEYRYRTKSTTTSYATSLSGYTQNGGSWVKSGSGNIDYVSSWPSGFNKSASQYTSYNKTPKTASETATTKTTVSTSTIGYLYWHWCRGDTSGPGNRLVSDCKDGSYKVWHCFFSSSAIGYNSDKKAFQSSRSSLCKDSYWWVTTYAGKNAQLPVKRCSYTTYNKLFNYYKWSDWSEWSPTPVASSDTRDVQTRTVYRFQPDGIMDEDNSGEERTVSGSVDTSFAGKQATLFIYKVNEASDFTNEYVGQTTIGEDGSYAFTFKLREEPSVATGDFTVVLGIEGTSSAIYLDTIEAPKKTYNVKFYDYNGEVISEQAVAEGENADLPSEDLLARDGYTFTNWSDTNTNITSDKELRPEYKINTYHVVFVDWQANKVEMQQFEYGAPLITPVPEEPEEGVNVEWVTQQISEGEDGSSMAQDVVVNDGMSVVSDMVVTTRYAKKTCSVTIMNADDNVVSNETVEWGTAAAVPDMEDEVDNKVFLGWVNTAEDSDELIEDTLITDTAILCPKFAYATTVDTPIASIATGEYTTVQTVVLTCDTDDASIFYTTDGSEPSAYNGELYTGPLTINQPTVLKFYAQKAGMNDSSIMSETYVVNTENARSAWMPFDQLPADVVNNMEDYSVVADTGYRYKDVKTTTSLTEANTLQASGWTLVDTDAYTDYTPWSESFATDLGDYIEAETETQPIYEESAVYEYSHYKYEDTEGNIVCAKEAVEGFDCEYETIQFDTKLTVAGFDEDRASYFLYDGEKWYNQNKVTAQVEVGSKYRYRYKVATYEKWTPFTTTAPTAGETREYQEADVYSYARNTCHLVTIHDIVGLPTYQIVDEGDKIDTSSAVELEGFPFESFYKDEEHTQQWNINSDTVTSAVTLYIARNVDQHTVIFAYEDGTEIDTQTVDYGTDAQAPEVDEIPGYKFVGWSSDAYLTVTEDTTVYAKYVSEDEYATVELDNDAINLFAGKSIELTAVITPSSHDQNDIEWSSSDEQVAVVSDNGTVTGVGSGTATITATVGETGETATCSVTVRTNVDTSLVLLKNAKFSVDGNGYLRGVKAPADTAQSVLACFENSNARVVDTEGNQIEATASVGTGYKVQLVKNGAAIDEMTIIVVGDFNGDAAVNNRDVSMLLQCLVNKRVPNDIQILASDVNGDGSVNNRDALLVSMSTVNKVTL